MSVSTEQAEKGNDVAEDEHYVKVETVIDRILNQRGLPNR